jgi:hypothetical protein
MNPIQLRKMIDRADMHLIDINLISWLRVVSWQLPPDVQKPEIPLYGSTEGKADAARRWLALSSVQEGLSQISYVTARNKGFSELDPLIYLLRNVKTLSLRENHFERFPPDFAQMRQVAWLDLSCNPLVSCENLPLNLRTLFLVNCPNLQSLAGLPEGLQILYVGENVQLTDANLLEIPHSVESLSMKGCAGITVDGLLQLPPNVRRVALNGCTQFTVGDIEFLRAQRPACEFIDQTVIF